MQIDALVSRALPRTSVGRRAAYLAACLVALALPLSVAAQASSAEAAVRALRPGLHEISGVDVDVDGDGDADRLVLADEGVDVPHCVVAVRGPSGWVAHAITSLGSDRPDRCLGVVAGRVVVAQHSAGAADAEQAWAFVATVHASGVTISRPVELASEGVAHFDALRARPEGAQIVVEAPSAGRVATLTP